jgi:hypothetical protein
VHLKRTMALVLKCRGWLKNTNKFCKQKSIIRKDQTFLVLLMAQEPYSHSISLVVLHQISHLFQRTCISHQDV